MDSERLFRPEGAHEAPSGPDDEALIRAIAAGDRDALGALYDRHADLLCALARRLLGDMASAEAALHDLFVEVWHEAARLELGGASVRTWLVGKMRALGLRRRAERSNDLPPPALAPAPQGSRPGIAGLPAELAFVVELAYFEGLSAAEVATRLGLPVALVRDRLVRALSLLRNESDSVKEGRS